MLDKFETTNEIAKRKSRLIKTITDIEFHPVLMHEKVFVEKYTMLSLSQFTKVGAGLEPLAAAFQKVINGSGTTSGFYKVKIPKGAQLAKFKNGSGYLGSVLKGNGAIGGGQAILTPLVFNPMMLFTAAALVTMDKKIDNIQEMQRELFEFQVQNERSKLIGNFHFLTDVQSNYKYHWNNETFRNSNYNKVLDIKDKTGGKIDFHRGRITSLINKKSFFRSDQWIEKQLLKLRSEFEDYQLALYLYAFSTYLEIIFLEDFKSEYLEGVSKKLDNYLHDYNELYNICLEKIQVYTQFTLQTKMYKVSTRVSSEIEDSLVANRDFKKLVVKTFVLANESQEKKRSENIERTIKEFENFLEKQNDYVRPFLENINTFNELYNQPLEIIFDKENIYIGTTEVK